MRVEVRGLPREDGDLSDVVREQVKGDQPQPEHGRRDEGEGGDHRGAIEDRSSFDRRDDPDGYPHEEPEDHGAEDQKTRRGQSVEDDRLDRGLRVVALAEAELGREDPSSGPALYVDVDEREAAVRVDVGVRAEHEVLVLDVDRLIEVELLADLRDRARRSVAAGTQLRRIRRGEDVEDHEDHRAHDEEHRDAPEHAASYVAKHSSVVFVGGSGPAAHMGGGAIPSFVS